MKQVHLAELMSTKKIHARYLGVKQPMLIYHSTEELMTNEKNRIVIEDLTGLQRFIREKLSKIEKGWVDIQEHNVWIATGETVIPDRINAYGDILYEVPEDGTTLYTDNCYIHLSVLFIDPSVFILFTSSGIYKANLQTWKFSAAVKPQFLRISTQQQNPGARMTYEERLNYILTSNKTKIPFTRVFYLMFNPLSETFLNADATVKKVFGGYIKAKDREKIINSKKFQQIMIKELNRLMPSMKDVLVETIPAKDFAELMKNFVTETVKDKSISVDDKIKSLNFVGEKAYPEIFGMGDGIEGALLPEHNKPVQIAPSYNMNKEEKDKLMPPKAEEIKVEEISDDDLFDEFDEQELAQRSEDVGEVLGYSEQPEDKKEEKKN